MNDRMDEEGGVSATDREKRLGSIRKNLNGKIKSVRGFVQTTS
jgi:hypothetical protein